MRGKPRVEEIVFQGDEMPVRDIAKRILPGFFKSYIGRRKSKVSGARIESNRWIRLHGKDIRGRVLSIGSGNDGDRQGGSYRDYFPAASSYTTSEVSDEFGCDLTLDVRSMPEITSEVYDCIFCAGVMEHVDDYHAAFNELTRILKVGGILLLGLPFRQAIHWPPQDFWRFTEYGIRHLLKDLYEIVEVAKIDEKKGEDFPSAYWVKAKKVNA